MDGYSKFPIFIRPTIESCLNQGIDPIHGYRSIASWLIFARKAAAGKAPVPYHEPSWNALEPLLRPGAEQIFASTSQLWGKLPDRHPGFISGMVTAIQEAERAWPM